MEATCGYRLKTFVWSSECYSGSVKLLLPCKISLKIFKNSFLYHFISSALFHKCRAKSFARDRHKHGIDPGNRDRYIRKTQQIDSQQADSHRLPTGGGCGAGSTESKSELTLRQTNPRGRFCLHCLMQYGHILVISNVLMDAFYLVFPESYRYSGKQVSWKYFFSIIVWGISLKLSLKRKKDSQPPQPPCMGDAGEQNTARMWVGPTARSNKKKKPASWQVCFVVLLLTWCSELTFKKFVPFVDLNECAEREKNGVRSIHVFTCTSSTFISHEMHV